MSADPPVRVWFDGGCPPCRRDRVRGCVSGGSRLPGRAGRTAPPVPCPGSRPPCRLGRRSLCRRVARRPAAAPLRPDGAVPPGPQPAGGRLHSLPARAARPAGLGPLSAAHARPRPAGRGPCAATRSSPPRPYQRAAPGAVQSLGGRPKVSSRNIGAIVQRRVVRVLESTTIPVSSSGTNMICAP